MCTHCTWHSSFEVLVSKGWSQMLVMLFSVRGFELCKAFGYAVRAWLTAGSAGSACSVRTGLRPFEVGMVHWLAHCSCLKKMLAEVEVVVLELAWQEHSKVALSAKQVGLEAETDQMTIHEPMTPEQIDVGFLDHPHQLEMYLVCFSHYLILNATRPWP